jgi:16S rRNA (cytidine1402-2'-O)-methyltransferase
MSTLYLVPTPIGNLEDITLRALRVLREVALIAAEDTRTSAKLLQHYDIQTPLTSYHEYNKITKAEAIFDLLKAGKDVALIADAGTPTISDPGYELVSLALKAGVKVVPLPGASALLCALAGSGLPTDSFAYFGFLPRKTSALHDLLTEIAPLRQTLIFYESPNRLVESLYALREVLGDRQAVVARELSKYYEEFQRDTLSKLIDHYEGYPPKGEITLLVAGHTQTPTAWSEEEVRLALRTRLAKGEKRSTAAKNLAQESGWDRRALYDLEL